MCGGVWGCVGGCGGVWGGVGRCGAVWGGVGRCGEVWGCVGGVGFCANVPVSSHTKPAALPLRIADSSSRGRRRSLSRGSASPTSWPSPARSGESGLLLWGFQQVAEGFPMGFPWVVHGCPMSFPWVFHGCPMGFPWVSHGCPMSFQ